MTSEPESVHPRPGPRPSVARQNHPVKAKLVLERYQALLAFIDQRAGDENENAFSSLLRIVEHAGRDQKWLRRQARKTKGTR
ncbi:MAG: hypothetical protein RIS56_1482 [Verrucomicrobiota bacterium]